MSPDVPTARRGKPAARGGFARLFTASLLLLAAVPGAAAAATTTTQVENLPLPAGVNAMIVPHATAVEGKAMALWAAGTLTIHSPAALASVKVRAAASGRGGASVLNIRVDGALIKSFTVPSGMSWSDYEVTLPSRPAGPLSLAFEFTGDDPSRPYPENDRNLYLDQLTVTAPVVQAPPVVPAPPVPAKLELSPPALTNPTTIDLPTATNTVYLSDSKDYILKYPPTRKGATVVIGGRNIRIIGGSTYLPKGQGPNYIRALFFMHDTKTTDATPVPQVPQQSIYIEGLKIDNSGLDSGEGDGIAFSGSEPTDITVQNSQIEGLWGGEDVAAGHQHADVLQPFGGAKSFRVNRVMGSSSIQGIFARPDKGAIGTITIDRTVMTSFNRAGEPDLAGQGGDMYWFTSGDGGTVAGAKGWSADSVTLGPDVYAGPRAGDPFARSVWPDPLNKQSPSQLSPDGKLVSFDNVMTGRYGDHADVRQRIHGSVKHASLNTTGSFLLGQPGAGYSEATNPEYR